jgi:hypothetical protein
MAGPCDVCVTWGIENCPGPRLVHASMWGPFTLAHCVKASEGGWPPLWALTVALNSWDPWREALRADLVPCVESVMAHAGWDDEALRLHLLHAEDMEGEPDG